MKTFNIEMREDVIGVLIGVLDRVQISGKEAEAIVMARQTLTAHLQGQEQPKEEKAKK